MKPNALYVILLLFALCACRGGQSDGQQEQGDTIPMHYAHNLTLIQYRDSLVAILRNPWDTTQVLDHYVLVPRDSREHTNSTHGSGRTVVHTPLTKAAVFASVHCALIKELGKEASIGGVADKEYIGVPSVQDNLRKGKVADIGNSMQPNLERIMELEPDALMPSPFQNSGGYGRLERIGIPIIECADYMEVSPLARAEWIKFYGRLFGAAEEADKLFEKIEKEYLSLKAEAAKATTRPTLLPEVQEGSTWYVPGGRSTMGIIYQDAGANYLWAETTESGSLSLNIESVMERALQADIWLLKYSSDKPLTYQSFGSENAAYAHFDAFKKHHIWGCNLTETGFFEETPFHPERLLRNLVRIVHPELNMQADKDYYQPLQ